MSIPGISGGMSAVPLGAGELPPMSIPGMSCGIGASVGAGVLPPISIPGISAGMLAVGAGELPDMSIPGMSIGILAGVVGGGLSDPTDTGTAAALSAVAPDASCCDVSIIDPRTAIPATVAPTDAILIRPRKV
jgi:hypothetical protein